MRNYILVFSIFIILIIIGYHFKEYYIDNDVQVELDDVNADINSLGHKIDVTNNNIKELDGSINIKISSLDNKVDTGNDKIYNKMSVMQENIGDNAIQLGNLDNSFLEYQQKSDDKFGVIDGSLVNLNNYFTTFKKDTDSSITNQFNNMKINLGTDMNKSIGSATDNLNTMFGNFKGNYDKSLSNVNTNLNSLDTLIKSLNIDYTNFKTSTSTNFNTTNIDIKNIKTSLTSVSDLIATTMGQLNQLSNVLNTAYTKTLESDLKYIKKTDLNAYPTITDVESKYTKLTQSANYINKTEIKFYIDEIKSTFSSYFKTIDVINNLLNTVKANVDTIKSSYVNKIDLPKLTMELTNKEISSLITTLDGLKKSMENLTNSVTSLTNNVNTNYVKKTDAELKYNTFAKQTDLSSYIAKKDIGLYGYALKTDVDKGIADLTATIRGITANTSSILKTLQVDNSANVKALYADISSYNKLFPTNWNGVYTKDMYATGNIGIGTNAVVNAGISNIGTVYGKNINIDEVGNFKKGITTSNTISVYGKDQTPFIEKNYADGFNKYGLSVLGDNLRVYSSCNINLTSGSSNDVVTINKDGSMVVNGRFVGNKNSVFNGAVVTQTLTNNSNLNVLGNLTVNNTIKGLDLNSTNINSTTGNFDTMNIKKGFNTSVDMNFNNNTVDWFNINNSAKKGLNINNGLTIADGLSIGALTRANKGELQINNGNKNITYFNSNNSNLNIINGTTNFMNDVNVKNILKVNVQPTLKYPTDLLNSGGILTNNLYSYGSVQISDDKGTLSRIISKDGVWGVSDKRLKKNIEPISNDELSYINNLDVVKFNKYDDTENKKHYGYIAQDIEQVYPNLVKTTSDNYKTVNYEEMIPLIAGNVKQIKRSLPKQDTLCLGNTCINENDLRKILSSHS